MPGVAARRAWLAVAVGMLIVVATGCGASRRAPGPRWLGLNDNTRSATGRTAQFVADGIVYDHNMDIVAGETPSHDGCRDWVPGWPAAHFFHSRGPVGVFDKALRAGMIPVVTIAYCGSGDDYGACRTDRVLARGRDPFVSQCLPASARDRERYVTGFIATANAMRAYVAARYPGRQVLFEAINEPWGYGSPNSSEPVVAAAYARIIARLLPAARAARIPPADIYVGALGDQADWVGLMYAADPALEQLVRGWYFHPYGLPQDARGGIQGVASVRSRHRHESGWSNVIVSEVGYCVTPYPPGSPSPAPSRDVCRANVPEVDTRSGTQAAEWLTRTLDAALPMHAAGWLRSLIVWDRADTQPTNPSPAGNGYVDGANDGWAMQRPDGSLTPQGIALVAFARAEAG